MRGPTPEQGQRMQAAYGLIRAGRAAEARAALAPLAAAAPWLSDAHHLLGLALRALGEADAAESAFAAAAGADPNRPEHRQEWGKSLSDKGHAQKAAGNIEAALASYEAAARANPQSHVAEHNVASAAADLMRSDLAVAAAQRSLAKGGDAPETWLVLGNALQGRGEAEEAEAAYRQAIARRSDYLDAHRELAQLIWMRTADVFAASATIDSAIAAHPDAAALKAAKANLLVYAGDPEGAFAAAAASSDLGALVAASQAALSFNPRVAVAMAERALAQADHPRMLTLLGQALLAAGEVERASKIAAELRARTPDDQNAIALQATAWRLLGDERYGALYDYSLVGTYTIDTPKGWSDLATYLSDLKSVLHGLHRMKTHPIGQSLRHGSQTSGSLLAVVDPVVRAFFQAIDGPVRAHIAKLGQGGDPVRARSTGDYRLSGAWSVRLRSGGFHVDHVHPDGWLSSACYIDIPAATAGAGREGWLKLGEPGVPTAPALAAERFVQPESGLLALFPSYMWHGTVPFAGDDERLTVAFDVVPS